MERSFQTAQDRLVKGLRVAEAKTLAEANAYLETEFIPWWNQTLAVVPASAADAHRPLAQDHSLAASLSYVESREVGTGYTIQFDHKIYRIARADIRAGLRGAQVRIEIRLDGSMAVRFRNRYLAVSECAVRPKVAAPAGKPNKRVSGPRPKSQWMKNFHFTHPDKSALSAAPAKPIGRPGRGGPAIVAFSVFKASAPEFHQSNLCQKSKTLGGTPQGPVDRGLAAVYFGANSVASALNLLRKRDLPKNHPHFKPYLSTPTSKQDTSTLRRIGHFYFACPLEAVKKSVRRRKRLRHLWGRRFRLPTPRASRFFHSFLPYGRGSVARQLSQGQILRR